MTTTRSETTLRLRDGREVLVREMRPDDRDRSLRFFRALPDADRKYLRRDVTRPEVVDERLREMKEGQALRRVAVVGDEIVAEGTLELEGRRWGEGVASIRLLVARPYQRLGLGMLMARELYHLAAERKVERIVVRMLKPQEGALRIFRKLGFREEWVIPEHARDQSGDWQDLVIMRCNLEALWQEMETLLDLQDWQRHR
jgi:RimJ/RimL family protein N-acetyltransferase